ncbi:hypothetical protein FRC09_016007 [Ceratobasidium sp. 395]|nr:hypothetical protein FRC09_016007 [Ceratobasidium sp. 395]
MVKAVMVGGYELSDDDNNNDVVAPPPKIPIAPPKPSAFKYPLLIRHACGTRTRCAWIANRPTRQVVPAGLPAPVAPNAPVTPESVATPDLQFDLVADIHSFVPVSDGATLLTIVAPYKRRPSEEKSKIPKANQLSSLVRRSFYNTHDGVTKGKAVKPP